jgi:hypothetical protein
MIILGTGIGTAAFTLMEKATSIDIKNQIVYGLVSVGSYGIAYLTYKDIKKDLNEMSAVYKD